MKPSKIVLLNGPKGCGKTEAVLRLKRESVFSITDARCKDHLWKLTWEFFCLSRERFFEIYENRDLKEVPLPEFTVNISAYNKLMASLDKPMEFSNPFKEEETRQLSVRQALIFVSEILCKPTFGQDYFGVARVKSLLPNSFNIDDSCGFDEELPPTLEHLGQENTLLLRIHGRGDFSGDSRRYISDGVVTNTLDIYNTSDEESFLKEVTALCIEFYNR